MPERAEWRDAEDENRRLRSVLRQARAHIVKIEGDYLQYDDPEASVAYIDDALSVEDVSVRSAIEAEVARMSGSTAYRGTECRARWGENVPEYGGHHECVQSAYHAGGHLCVCGAAIDALLGPADCSLTSGEER